MDNTDLLDANARTSAASGLGDWLKSASELISNYRYLNRRRSVEMVLKRWIRKQTIENWGEWDTRGE